MIGVDDARDAHGTPVRSLYGDRFADLSPRPRTSTASIGLVIDLQDVGARYYTFVWTAVLAHARRCARGASACSCSTVRTRSAGTRSVIEGKNQEETYRSFVGLEPIPIRHGLTLGEIVAWRAQWRRSPASCSRCSREGPRPVAHAPAWDCPFVMPSPNMPTYETALVYPGGCLLEGTNLSDGRGTTRPFEITGAPWVDGALLART